MIPTLKHTFITGLIAASCWSSLAVAQNLTTADKFKMMTAGENYDKAYFQEAYRLYKELRDAYPQNAVVNFNLGKTCLDLLSYDEALNYLSVAKSLDPAVDDELFLLLGRAQHRMGQLPEALESFKTFKAKLKGKEATSHIVNEHIYQVENAMRIMASPVNATVKNMGGAINSEFKESSPALSLDGTKFIFTTCRPDNVGGEKDPNFDIYFQDVWYSEKDSVTGLWKDAEQLSGDLNTKEHDACLGMSPDGSVIFVYRSVKGGDIFYSKKKKNGDWKAAVPLEGKVNSSYFETSASVTPDAKKFFFISERIGKGQGNGDIWVAKKDGKFDYGEPENLGPIVNSIDDENSVFIHPDGKTLFFSSNSKEAIGGYDIFRTEYKDGKWTKPINLGYPINTLGDEMHFVLNADGTKAYITTRREDTFGDFDIYEVDLTNYTLPEPPPTTDDKGNVVKESTETPGKQPMVNATISVIQGKILAKDDAEPLQVKISITDENGKTYDDIESNEAGEYFVTMDGNINYTLTIKAKGFKPVEEKVFLPREEGKTRSVIKVFLLENEE